MKKQRLSARGLRATLSALVLCTGLFYSSATNAQTVVNANNPDNLLCAPTDITAVNTINTDMMYNPNGGSYLLATVVDGNKLSSPFQFTELYLEVIAGGGLALPCSSIALPPGARNPDVAIATYIGTPNADYDYIVTVVYDDGVGNVYYSYRVISSVGLAAPVIFGWSTPVILNTSGANASHARIDMSGYSPNPAYGSYHPLFHYGIVWQETTAANPAGIYGAVGYYSTGIFPNPIFNLSTPFAITLGDKIKPDVASRGFGTVSPLAGMPSREIYATWLDQGTNDWEMGSFQADKLTNVTSILPLTPTTVELGSSYFHDDPRIEAIVTGDVVAGNITYQTVATSDNSGFPEIHAYNDVASTPYNLVSAGVGGGPYNHVKPVVTGTGTQMNGLGIVYTHNTEFTTSYYSTYTYPTGTRGDYFSNSNDVFTGIQSTTWPDYYEINFNFLENSFSLAANNPAIAISTSSNVGYDLLTVWYRGYSTRFSTGEIYYKLDYDRYMYKNGTTGVNNINTERQHVVSPNPATTTLKVDGTVFATYTIVDVVGKTVSSGSVSSSSNTVAIDKLVPGHYLLNLSENGHTTIVKFVKQ